MSIEARRGRKGGALLAVLWLAAALSAIAFSLAQTVRTETQRTSNSIDGVRAYYLASGAIDRALLYMEWGPSYYSPPVSSFRFPFPGGEAIVEILPEASKLNVNRASREDVFRLLAALGAEPARAQEIVEAIVDWRTPRPVGEPGLFDPFYLSLNPSFRARHASFQEIEELLLVKGMTPELFHGGYVRDPDGRLAPRRGLKDCVTVWGSGGAVDVNTAHPAVLAAIGLSPDRIAAVVTARRESPIRSHEQLQAMGVSGGRLGIGGGSIVTLRSTARLRVGEGKLSDLRRSVAATVKLLGVGSGQSHHVLRWRESEWVPEWQWN